MTIKQAREFNSLTLKQRVDLMKARIANGEIEAYAKSINSRFPHPHGLVGYLGDEVAYFNPEVVKRINEWMP